MDQMGEGGFIFEMGDRVGKDDVGEKAIGVKAFGKFYSYVLVNNLCFLFLV